MARRLLTRLLRDEKGYSLTEQLVVAAGLAVILAAILGLADLAAKTAPADRERVHAVREAQVEIDKMTRELRAAHAITIDPLKATATVLKGGVAVTVVYDCSASPVNGLRKCVRTQTGGTAGPALTVLPRVANAASRPVFAATQRGRAPPRGGGPPPPPPPRRPHAQKAHPPGARGGRCHPPPPPGC